MAKFDLNTHLTCRFVSAITIAILAMGLTAVLLLVTNTNTLVSDMKIELSTNEKVNLRVRTHNFAGLSQEQFEQIITDMDLASNYTADIFNSNLPIVNFYPVYEGVITLSSTQPPGGIGDDNYAAWYSLTGSTTYQNNASVMADVFRPALKSNPAYQGVYVGFEDSTWLHHPFIDLSSFPTLSYTCVSTGSTVIGYDPKCRGWYNDAKLNPNEFRFSEPYNDAATGSVLITASKSVHDVDGNFIGAIGFDISMSESGFEDSINNGVVINNGYTYIYDTSGNAIFSPEIPDRDSVYSVLDVEFSSSSEKTKFGPILDSMISGGKGERDFTKSGDEWVINYEPVNGTIYGVAMVVPYSDINEPANDLDNTISAFQLIMIIVAVVFTAVATAIATVYTKQCAHSFTEPLKTFTRFTHRITQGDLEQEMGQVECGSSDLKIINNKFSTLIHALRFANAQYFNNNMAAALENYKKMETIFNDLNNKRGLGVVWNNMAEAMSCLDDVADHTNKSKEYFNKAIENAREHIANAQKEKLAVKDNQAKLDELKTVELFYKITLGKRYANLSLFYLELKDFENALLFNDKAFEMHEIAEDVIGTTITTDNRALIFMEMGKAQEAEGLFISAYSTLLASFKKAPTAKKAEALQYSSMNLGIHYKKIGEYEKAREHLNYALILTENIHLSVRNQCLLALVEIFESPEYSKYPQAAETAANWRSEFNLFNSKPQHIHFVLDVSGSMITDDRIGKSRDAIMLVINCYLNSNDEISLTVFHTEQRRVFTRLTKGKSSQEIMHAVMGDTELQGRTKFYDAVGAAVVDVTRSSMNNDDQWIIALTDGADNESVEYATNGRININLIELVKSNNIGLFVLTIGKLRTVDDINKLTFDQRPEDTKRRRHESITNPEKIKETFQNVAAVIKKGNHNIESL